MQPHAAARSFRSRARPSPRLYLGWLLLWIILEVLWVILETTRTISILFLNIECTKWTHASGDPGEAGTPEMQPREAATVDIYSVSVEGRQLSLWISCFVHLGYFIQEFFLIWALGELSRNSSRLSETHPEAILR